MPKDIKITDDKKEVVKKASGMGLPHDQICSLLNISRPTLYKYYQEELREGKATANFKVANNLFKIATSQSNGAVTAGIFWLKTQAGWKEHNVIEVTNSKQEHDTFRKLITDIRDAKLSKQDSIESTHKLDS
jgi:hypothetical protein|tara:strand:+ start:1465 stop:1860 length:396 start_codon:yes stop_codon:yes gene_type:complete